MASALVCYSDKEIASKLIFDAFPGDFFNASAVTFDPTQDTPEKRLKGLLMTLRSDRGTQTPVVFVSRFTEEGAATAKRFASVVQKSPEELLQTTSSAFSAVSVPLAMRETVIESLNKGAKICALAAEQSQDVSVSQEVSEFLGISQGKFVNALHRQYKVIVVNRNWTTALILILLALYVCILPWAAKKKAAWPFLLATTSFLVVLLILLA